MELKMVYRVLRKLSGWVIWGWYSEVYIEGTENVLQAGPLIVYVLRLGNDRLLRCDRVSTHHNEMIDVAALGELKSST